MASWGRPFPFSVNSSPFPLLLAFVLLPFPPGYHFRRVRVVARNEHDCHHVRLSERISETPTGRIFGKFVIGDLCEYRSRSKFG